MADERVELEKVAPEEDTLLRPGYPRRAGYPEGFGGYGYPSSGPDSDGVHLRDIWRLVRKRKWLIMIIAVIVTSLVTVDAYRDKSVYQASAIIEIGRDLTMFVRAGDLYLQTDDYYENSASGIKTSMLILKSRPVLEGVARGLKLDQHPNFLESRRRTLWGAIDAIRGRLSEDEKKVSGPAVMSAGDSTTTADDNSPEAMRRLSPYVGVLAGGLSVEQVRETRALRISFTHIDPTVAASVANGVANDFIERSFETKTEQFKYKAGWLEVTTRELESKVEQAEQALANYTRDHEIFSTDNSGTLTTSKLSRLNDQALRAEGERILKQSLYEQVKAGRLGQLPESYADPTRSELQKKLNELAVLFAELDVRYGEDHPKVIEVKQKIEVLKSQVDDSRKGLEDKLRADYERSVREETALKAALESAKGEAVEQNQAAIQFNILKQNVDTAKQLYTDFLQRYNQSKVQVAEQRKNIRIIEPAQIPGGPVGPQRMRTIMLGFFLSLAAGVGLAFLLEYLDNTIKTVEDVNRYAQLPALSVIPMLGAGSHRRKVAGTNGKKALGNGHATTKLNNLVAHSSPLVALDTRSSAAEAYRVLRTSVLLSTAGSAPKIILVTSGQPGEGKTTTVVNTAISLAQLGAKVLIIDCDLRKPATHKVFGVDHSRGMSNYLSREVEIDSLIQKLQIPNLSLLPCGPIPPNPAELISSEKMKQMLAMLSERYDHILIDSPPLINVTDPVILSTLVDGVILVVHGGKSTRDVVRRARQELSTVGAKIFGVVLNNVDLRAEGYDNYYYYRYYSDYAQPEVETRG
jgi:capsular exopolysaccharide synthesis family protein